MALLHRHLTIAAFFIAAAPVAQAATISLDVTSGDDAYVDFFLSGSFTATDTNGDGVYTEDEVTARSLMAYAEQEPYIYFLRADTLDKLFLNPTDPSTYVLSFSAVIHLSCYNYVDSVGEDVSVETSVDLTSGGTLNVVAAGNYRYDDCDDFSDPSVVLYSGLFGDLVVEARYSDDAVSPVPLPASLPALLVGVGALAMIRRRG